jgi:hypothetical protein
MTSRQLRRAAARKDKRIIDALLAEVVRLGSDGVRPLTADEERAVEAALAARGNPHNPYSFMETVHHEAGHAVAVTILRGHAPRYMERYPHGALFPTNPGTIPAAPTLDDVCFPRALVSPDHAALARTASGLSAFHDIMYLLAGHIAQVRYTGKPGEFSGRDVDQAYEGAELVARTLTAHGTPHDTAEVMADAQRRTERFVADQWPAITRVAAAFAVRPRIEGAEIADLVAG